MATTNDTTRMTRAQLIASHVEAGVARWGEAERAGLLTQAQAKSTDSLRWEHAQRVGDAEAAQRVLDSTPATELPRSEADMGGIVGHGSLS